MLPRDAQSVREGPCGFNRFQDGPDLFAAAFLDGPAHERGLPGCPGAHRVDEGQGRLMSFAEARRHTGEAGTGPSIVIGLSGHGFLDMPAYEAYIRGELA